MFTEWSRRYKHKAIGDGTDGSSGAPVYGSACAVCGDVHGASSPGGVAIIPQDISGNCRQRRTGSARSSTVTLPDRIFKSGSGIILNIKLLNQRSQNQIVKSIFWG
ncbi:hypothetical protein QTP88_011135 [Uroleucon formosanum]